MTKSYAFLPLLLLTSGCAVATIDEPLEGEEGDISVDGDGDGDDDVNSSSGGAVVVVTTGGGSNLGSSTGGSTSTGGSSATGGSSSTGGSESTGGVAATGGSGQMDPPVDPSGCTAIGHQEDSGEFGTTGEKCFIVDYTAMMYGWRVSNSGGRTVTVNGEVVGQGDVSSGSVPWPGSSPYLVEFSSGSQANTTWAFW